MNSISDSNLLRPVGVTAPFDLMPPLKHQRGLYELAAEIAAPLRGHYSAPGQKVGPIKSADRSMAKGQGIGHRGSILFDP